MFGHRQGAVAMKNMVKTLLEFPKIKFASFFAFSTENWNREQKEIDYIFRLVEEFLKDNEKAFDEDNVKFVAMGDLSKFPKNLSEKIQFYMEKTKDNAGLVVNLALNYGGRADIVNATNNLLKSGEKEVTIESFKQNLYSQNSPDIDFLVRTSGEMRISNFMLFQMAYAELYFTKTCWPGFGKKQLLKALKEFSKRNRTFGGNKWKKEFLQELQ